MAGLKEVIQRKGVFCALYRDRGSHFWLTPKVGGRVDPQRLTQVGRALRELGVQMIPAYSPQARGRSERNFGTWQGRLPQELRLHGINSLEGPMAFSENTTWPSSIAAFRWRAAQSRQRVCTPAQPRSGSHLRAAFERTVNAGQHGQLSEPQFGRSKQYVGEPAWLVATVRCISIWMDRSADARTASLGRYSAQGETLGCC